MSRIVIRLLFSNSIRISISISIIHYLCSIICRIQSCLRAGLPCNSSATSGYKNFVFLPFNLCVSSIDLIFSISNFGDSTDYKLFINCGGESVTVDGKEYERDVLPEGTSNYYLSKSGKWAFSSTGNFVGGNTQFVAARASNASLYSSARLSPLSLKYYGLCLQPGKYSVTLHFAEIVFTSDSTLNSLGRRVFDVSIQVNILFSFKFPQIHLVSLQCFYRKLEKQ